MARYQDRIEAAKVLTAALPPLQADETVVLALPRGGVPIGAVIAEDLGAPLDIVLVRKVGAPGNPELAVGAITGSGEAGLHVNAPVARAYSLSHAEVQGLAQRELPELIRRKNAYLKGRKPFDIKGKTALLVDDGIATGSTVQAAINALRAQGPERIILAVPVASPEVIKTLETQVDQIICPMPQLAFGAVGGAYDNFPQTSDDEVIGLLEKARQRVEMNKT